MGTGAVVLAVGLALQTGGGVEGMVLSTDGDRPIAYAHVHVVGDSVSDWTDARGVYRLEGLTRGRWRIRVAHQAYDTLDLDVFVPGDRDVSLDVTLEARPGPAPEPLADFEPFQVQYTLPSLLNSDEITRVIQQHYPEDLLQRRQGGESVLLLWLDEQGRVVRGVLSSSSGQPSLDSMALHVSESMRFRPAKNGENPVRIMVRIPVMFKVPEPESSRETAGG